MRPWCVHYTINVSNLTLDQTYIPTSRSLSFFLCVYFSIFILLSIFPPFHKDLLSLRLSAFLEDLPSFTLFLIWNFFPLFTIHVPITWSTITLLIQLYFLSLSYFNPFYLLIYLNPFPSPTLPIPTPHPTYGSSLVFVRTVTRNIFRKQREYVVL